MIYKLFSSWRQTNKRITDITIPLLSSLILSWTIFPMLDSCAQSISSSSFGKSLTLMHMNEPLQQKHVQVQGCWLHRASGLGHHVRPAKSHRERDIAQTLREVKSQWRTVTDSSLRAYNALK